MKKPASRPLPRQGNGKEILISTIRVKYDDLLEGLGQGPVVTFSHGWPLNSDAWDGSNAFHAQNGFHVVAHGRRGHAPIAKPPSGNDMNGDAADALAA